MVQVIYTAYATLVIEVSSEIHMPIYYVYTRNVQYRRFKISRLALLHSEEIAPCHTHNCKIFAAAGPPHRNNCILHVGLQLL